MAVESRAWQAASRQAVSPGAGRSERSGTPARSLRVQRRTAWLAAALAAAACSCSFSPRTWISAAEEVISHDRTDPSTGKKRHSLEGPMMMRPRSRKIKDARTGYAKPFPAKAYDVIDYFGRTFPEHTIEEHKLVERWEEMVHTFGSTDFVNQLLMSEPGILKMYRQEHKKCWISLCHYLGPKTARKIVTEYPLILKRGKNSNKLISGIPALLNVFGTRAKLASMLVKVPGLIRIQSTSFYNMMPDLAIINSGDHEKALEVVKDAMDRIKRSPLPPHVPNAYPLLCGIFGGLEEAHKAIEAQPMILGVNREELIADMLTLRESFPNDHDYVMRLARKIPQFFLREGPCSRRINLRSIARAMDAYFGDPEKAKLKIMEHPEVLLLSGRSLQNAMRFAKRRLGSDEMVAKHFDLLLERTGLINSMKWTKMMRPRNGPWKDGQERNKPVFSSWHILTNPKENPHMPVRGQWTMDDPRFEAMDLEAKTLAEEKKKQEAEVSPA